MTQDEQNIAFMSRCDPSNALTTRQSRLILIARAKKRKYLKSQSKMKHTKISLSSLAFDDVLIHPYYHQLKITRKFVNKALRTISRKERKDSFSKWYFHEQAFINPPNYQYVY